MIIKGKIKITTLRKLLKVNLKVKLSSDLHCLSQKYSSFLAKTNIKVLFFLDCNFQAPRSKIILIKNKNFFAKQKHIFIVNQGKIKKMIVLIKIKISATLIFTFILGMWFFFVDCCIPFTLFHISELGMNHNHKKMDD